MLSPFTVGLIVDIIFILIFVINITVGYFRGFVKTIFGFVTVVAAIASGYFFCHPLSSLLESTPVYNGIFSGLKRNLTAYFNSLSQEQLDEMMTSGDTSSSFVESFGRSFSEIAGEYSRLAAQKGSDTMESLVDYIVEPACSTILVALCFIAIFVLSLIVLKLIGALFKLATKLPVIKTFNRFLGAVMGAAFAFIQAILLAVLLDALLPFIDLSDAGITLSAVQNSGIYCFFSGLNPIEAFLPVAKQ